MKRRDFIRLTAAVPAILAFGCGEDKEETAPPPAGKKRIGRTELLRFDGLTSMHEHVDSERGAEILLEAMSQTGIAHTLMLGAYESLLHGASKPDWGSGAKNNELLLKLVADHPAQLSMFAVADGREVDPVAIVRGYLERGARGVKMYNGASNYRAMPMNADPLQPLFRFCELHGVPVLIHVNPPHLNEFLGVVRDYPNIPWICPHLFVMTKPKEIERMARILLRHPNVHTDISFGFESWMHENLQLISESRDQLREIFIRHAGQIFYGTDVVVATNSPHRTVEWAANSFSEYRKILELDEFHHRVKSRRKTYEGDISGLGLPEDVLRKIYVENPRKFFDAPRPRFDADDLETVLRALPKGAKLGDGGRHALLAVAAVGVLSTLEGLGPNGAAPGVKLVADAKIAAAGAARLGVPVESIEVLADTAAVKDRAARDSGVAALIAFDDLDARFRALPIGGVDPCVGATARCAAAGQATRSACFGDYPLLLPVSSDVGDGAAVFDPHELRTVIMTGCSLPGKGMTDTPTAAPLAVIERIAPTMMAADIAHVSFENSLIEGCAQDLDRWKFCYPKEWLDVVDALGADVIELTGNHLRDFGVENAKKSIAEYDRRGYLHFGGGANLKDALRPAVIRIRGLRVGFVGINRLNAEKNGASEGAPGPLTRGERNFEDVLEAAKRECDAFVFTYHGGYEFSPTPWNDMVLYAHQAIDAGAIGAFGMHAHMPMGAEVYEGAFVSYGLGNFLFRHPSTVIPNVAMTERGMVCRIVLYGSRPLAANLMPIEMENGVISPSLGEKAAATASRVRNASYPGLEPQRVLREFADARVDVPATKSVPGALSVHLKLGYSGQLISLTEDAAKGAGDPVSALAMLRDGVKQGDRWSLKGIKLAVPLMPGWTLPQGGFDAVRVWLTKDEGADARTIELAAQAAVPIQLAVPGGATASSLERRIARAGKAQVVIPGLPMLLDEREAVVDLLRRNKNLWIDTSGPSPDDFERLFRSLAAEPEPWRAFFGEFKNRILLASGGYSRKKKLLDVSARILRALRWALERESFPVPLPKHAKQSEWVGYPYEEEPRLAGLHLDPAIVDPVVGGSFHKLFGA